MEGIAPPSIFKFAKTLVKRHPRCKRAGNSIFCDLFVLVAIVGQLVKQPPRRCLGTSLIYILIYISNSFGEKVNETLNGD